MQHTNHSYDRNIHLTLSNGLKQSVPPGQTYKAPKGVRITHMRYEGSSRTIKLA